MIKINSYLHNIKNYKSKDCIKNLIKSAKGNIIPIKHFLIVSSDKHKGSFAYLKIKIKSENIKLPCKTDDWWIDYLLLNLQFGLIL